MWVTKEQMRRAKQYDLLTYLQRADPFELKKTSRNEYCLKSHDSLKISNGMWHWYSRNIGGRSAVDYLIKVKGYKFPDAVMEVNRTMKGNLPSFFNAEKQKKEFRLPARNEDNDKVISYLLSRGIDKRLIEMLIKNGVLYESRQHHSVVFVGNDANGRPAHATYRATDGSAVKGDFGGSNKEYCLRIEQQDADTVRVFESAIDLISYLTLCIGLGKKYMAESYISIAGVSASGHTDVVKLPLALTHYLEMHPQTRRIILNLDSDGAGIQEANNIRMKLADQYEVFIEPPPSGKDYNEYLQIMRKETE